MRQQLALGVAKTTDRMRGAIEPRGDLGAFALGVIALLASYAFALGVIARWP